MTWNLLKNLTLRDIRSQYKRTILGRLWSLINPLAQIAVFSVVFGVFFQVPVSPGVNSGVEFFPVWIGVGVIAWGFISSTITQGMGSLVANAGLLSKVYFPRSVLVTSTVLSIAFTFLTELAVLAAIMAVIGGPEVLLYVPLLIPLLGLTMLFVTGIALLLSVASVYFRDLQYLWNVVNQIWMYASGVMFSAQVVEGAQRRLLDDYGIDIPLLTLFKLNPAEQILSAFRNILYDFMVPSWETWLSIGLWASIVFAIGVLVFNRMSRDIVEEL